MLFLMRNLDQSRRIRQAMLVTAALIGLGVLALAIATADVTVAHAETRPAIKAPPPTAEGEADNRGVDA